MKIAIAAMLIFVCSACYCQCEFIRDEYDKFLKINILENQATLLLHDGEAHIGFVKAGDTVVMKLVYKVLDITSLIAKRSTPLMLEMANDSILTFYPSGLTTGKTTIGGKYMPNSTTITILYAVSNSDIAQLAAEGIKSFRLYLDENSIEKKVRDKHAGEIMAIASCMLAQLSK